MLQIERAIQEYLPILFLFLLDESPLDLLRPLQGYLYAAGKRGDSSRGRNGRHLGEPIPLWPGSNHAGQSRSPNAGGNAEICHLLGDDVH